MQNIENDMDELFRRAVDQAPLIPPSGRWDEVAQKLSGHSAFSVAKEKTNSLKKISGVFGYLFSGAIILTVLTTFITHHEINTQQVSSLRTENSAKEKIINSKYKDDKNTFTGSSNSQNKILSSYNTDLEKKNKSQYSPVPANVTEGKKSKDLSISSKSEEFKNNMILSLDKPIENDQFANVNPSIPFISHMNPLNYDNLLLHHKSIELKENINKSQSATPVKLNSFTNSHFYVGLTGGPLISQIKTQGIKKPGFDMGVLLGYRISKKLSVETGLLYTKQYYLSGGKYYNTATGGNTAIIMEGSRTAFEIPFKLNYYFLRNKSGGFYVSGGLSSFVGVNDKIIVNVGKNPQHPPQKLDYGVASYLPSYLSFGLGYDYKSGRTAHFRIEPYLQIPMSSTAGNTININAGGALQVYNAGIHLVIAEFIH